MDFTFVDYHHVAASYYTLAAFFIKGGIIMDVTLLNFSKRLNSTKQPTSEELAAGKKFEGLTLKELTNIE